MHARIPARSYCYTLAALALCAARISAAEVGVDGARFTLDGRPTFLLGCSYYAGLGAGDETLQSDLDALKQHGFNWVRVWATWAAFDHDVSAVDGSGAPRPPYVERLKRLVDECDRRGLIVNVTLSRGNGSTGPERLQGIGPHTRAVETILDAIGDRKNWYIDLSNERNIGDARFTSFEDLAALCDTVKKRDPRRLVTASHSGEFERADVERYLRTVKVDFLSLHRPREAGSAQQTGRRTKQIAGWVREIGPVVPLHYDEPFRRGYPGWEPTADDFRTDLQAAKSSGAAGWCFHNGNQKDTPDGRPRRSFDLRDKTLFEQLDAEERKFLLTLRAP
jgi:hypothetical protein